VDVVLNDERHAVQGAERVRPAAAPLAVGVPRCLEHLGLVHRNEGVEIAMGGDPAQQGPGELFAADLAVADEPRRLHHGQFADVAIARQRLKAHGQQNDGGECAGDNAGFPHTSSLDV
jgi:hypothetical protein